MRKYNYREHGEKYDGSACLSFASVVDVIWRPSRSHKCLADRLADALYLANVGLMALQNYRGYTHARFRVRLGPGLTFSCPRALRYS